MGSKEKYINKFVGITPKDYEDLEDRHRKVLEIFSKYRLNRILDVGCGDGNFTLLIGKACKAEEVYGIEISKKGVEEARKNGIKAYQLDIDEEDFPFEDSYFDAIFAGEVIEHLFDPDHFLDEVYRVLKPNGISVLSTPNLASIHNRIALLFGFQPFPMGVSAKLNIGRFYEPNSEQAQSLDHIRVLALRSLKKLLNLHKFEIFEIKGSCAQLPENIKFKGLFECLDKFIALFPSLSYRSVVVCQKKEI